MYDSASQALLLLQVYQLSTNPAEGTDLFENRDIDREWVVAAYCLAVYLHCLLPITVHVYVHIPLHWFARDALQDLVCYSVTALSIMLCLPIVLIVTMLCRVLQPLACGIELMFARAALPTGAVCSIQTQCM